MALYDSARAIQDTEEDLATFQSLQRLIERLDRPALDAKLAVLQQQLEGFAARRKVLVFTEYVDTAEYLFEQLRPRGKVALVTGQHARHGNRPRNESTTEAIVRAFAPRANPLPPGEQSETTDPVDLLISTDVLAEGQNFQDCNIVINYDLTWNPVRVIQRVGRINRATSGEFHPAEDRRAHVLVFFPEAELTRIMDHCLTIVEANRRKLRHIAEIVGHGAPVLFEDEHTNRILFDRLAAAPSGSVYREIEQQQAQAIGLGAAFDDDELLAQEYRQLAIQHPEVAEQVRELPLPVITCRSTAAGDPGVAALFREAAGDSLRLRWLWLPRGDTVTDKKKGQVVKSVRSLPRALTRPATVDVESVRGQLTQWLADDAQRTQETGAMARPSASIAGKSIFTNLTERIDTEVTKMSTVALSEPGLEDLLTTVNGWIGAADQLVYAQREAAATAIGEVLAQRFGGRDLLAAAGELAQRFPVVTGVSAPTSRLSWELVVLEEIRREDTTGPTEQNPGQ